VALLGADDRLSEGFDGEQVEQQRRANGGFDPGLSLPRRARAMKRTASYVTAPTAKAGR